MSAAALVLALAAAAVHAGWNVLLADDRDPMATAAAGLATAELVLAPLALARWHIEASAWPYVAASAALELAYFLALTTGYSRGEMSVVYPLARGVAPVLVLAVGASVLHQATTGVDAAGVLLVAAGVLLVRGVRAPARSVSVAFGLLTAAAIAGYTLVDDRGIEHADAATYLWLILLPSAPVMPALLRGRTRAALTPRAAAVGVGSVLAYALILFALDRSAAAPVAAVRETSVVFGVALAGVILRERVTRFRFVGAVAVAAGVALVALG